MSSSTMASTLRLFTLLSLLLLPFNIVAHPPHEAFDAYDRLRDQHYSSHGTHGLPEFVPDDSRGLALAQRDGFQFENPSTDCKHTSQPRMYDLIDRFAHDQSFLFALLDENVDWTIVGHHPLAGHYPTAKLFFVNTLWRLGAAFDTSRFYVRILGLHAGCNSDWAVQELDYHGYTKGGDYWQVINLWVTRWDGDRVVEGRAYIDAPTTRGFLRDYEIWWNSTTDVDHTKYLPGPQGMPPF